LSTLPGTLIALAALRVLATLITLSLARLPLTSALDAATLSGRFSLLFATLSLLTLSLSLLTLTARCGRSALGLLVTLMLLLISIS
jgi:hypothetical protein